MQLTRSQLSALDDARHQRYVEQLCAFFRTHFVQWVQRFDDLALRGRVEQALAQAQRYGFQADESWVAFVGMALAAGPSFDTSARVAEFLAAPGADPDANVQWLFERVTRQLAPLSPDRDSALSGGAPS